MAWKKTETVAYEVTALLGQHVEAAEIKDVLLLEKDRVVNPDIEWIASQIKEHRANAGDLTTQLAAPESPAEDAAPSATPEVASAPAVPSVKPARKRSPKKSTARASDNQDDQIDPAAGELIEFLEQPKLVWPADKEFPADVVRFEQYDQNLQRRVAMLRATTVDGVKITLTLSEAIDNLRRRDKMAFLIPLFGPKVEKEIVAMVSKLRHAPVPDETGPYGEKLFSGRTDWFYHMLQIGILIWAGELNPPGLDLEAYPHRQGIRPATFRFRAVDVGFVARLVDAFDIEALDSGLIGGKLRDFEDAWIREFAAGNLTVTIGEEDKSIRDFRVSRRQGSEEQLRAMWSMVREETAKSAKSRRTSGRMGR